MMLKNESRAWNYLPGYRRIANVLWQRKYFDWVLDSLDASYCLVGKKDIEKVFAILGTILPAFYSFGVTAEEDAALGGEVKSADIISELNKLSSESVDAPGIHQSMHKNNNSNMAQSKHTMPTSESYDEEADMEPSGYRIDYYDAAALFDSIPLLKDVNRAVLLIFAEFEAGGLDLLRIFTNTERQDKYKLLQAFILNIFLWGSHPICDYYVGKENLKYGDDVEKADVLSKNNSDSSGENYQSISRYHKLFGDG